MVRFTFDKKKKVKYQSMCVPALVPAFEKKFHSFKASISLIKAFIASL